MKSVYQSKKINISSLIITELAVASGSGLINMVRIAKKVSRIINIQFKVIGFDIDGGLPKPVEL